MKIIHKLINLLILTAIITCGTSFVMKKTLPEKVTLLPAINKIPIQKETEDKEFNFDYRGTTYSVSPKAEYELWGLVVTHNNIGGIGDIYHTEDSVDLKDICVVWGNNAKTGVYEKGKYKSGSWTCYWRFSDAESWSQFSESQIANNHLLTSDPIIQEQIRNLRIGDQVHIKGYLVNYSNAETGWKRETSLTRKDTGNHACEVVYVNELEILKPGNQLWYQLFLWSKIALISLLILKVLTTYLSAHLAVKSLTIKKQT